MTPENQHYRGRLAPSPTGYLHLGHARTFWIAQERARARNGLLVFRNDDLDRQRVKGKYVTAMIEDMRWFGLTWQEGPDCGGSSGPYDQSARSQFYLKALEQLQSTGRIYPCVCSRKDIATAARAPHAGEDDEPVYPGTCRGLHRSDIGNKRFSWRLRVSDGEIIPFLDENLGPQQFVAGIDFGDFVVWRHDGVPAYQLACVVDDSRMSITEVVRGADLLKSTARQILLYRALGLQPPGFYHCPLVTDECGVRLAKRAEAHSLRRFRELGISPEMLRLRYGSFPNSLNSDRK
jgi:glutamyl-tRNA synthetase